MLALGLVRPCLGRSGSSLRYLLLLLRFFLLVLMQLRSVLLYKVPSVGWARNPATGSLGFEAPSECEPEELARLVVNHYSAFNLIGIIRDVASMRWGARSSC